MLRNNGVINANFNKRTDFEDKNLSRKRFHEPAVCQECQAVFLNLQYAVRLAQKFNAELHLLHVINEQPEIDAADLMVENNYHQAKARLQNTPSIGNHQCKRLLAAVRRGKPYREILAYAKEQNIDLIAAGAHGADFGSKTLFGSNVERVLRQAPCAMIVARPYKPIFTRCGETSGGIPS